MNELVKIVNVNYDFYEYLHLQTDTKKLEIPEILLRGQQIDLFFLVEYLVSYYTHTFQAIYHNRKRKDLEQSNEHKKGLIRNRDFVSKLRV